MTDASRGRFASTKIQALLSVLDQGLSSVTNFGAVIVAATLLSPRDFGAFAVAYALYGIFIAGEQALVGSELVLTKGDAGLKLTRSREALAFAFVLGVVAAMVTMISALAAPGVKTSLFGLAVALPLLFVQDAIRFAASTLQRGEIAILSDGLWLVLSWGVFIGLHLHGDSAGPGTIFFSWAVTGAFSALLVLPFFGRWTAVPSLRRFRDRSYLGYRFVWEFLALRALGQGLTLSLAFFASLAAVGAVRGANTLFGPLTVALLAAGSFGAPLVMRAPARLRDRVLGTLGLVLVSMTVAVFLLFLSLPHSVGTRILGDSWDGARTMLLPVGAQIACTAVSTVAYLALRLVDPRSTLPLRLWAAAAYLPGFFIGYYLNGVVGAVWGMACGSLVQAVLGCTHYFRLRVRGSGVASLAAA